MIYDVASRLPHVTFSLLPYRNMSEEYRMMASVNCAHQQPLQPAVADKHWCRAAWTHRLVYVQLLPVLISSVSFQQAFRRELLCGQAVQAFVGQRVRVHFGVC
jgi:hypothetical protein